MNLFGRELHGFAKVLVILVAVFLVASGMCGLQLLMDSNGMNGGAGYILIPLGVLELIAILLSAGGIVLLLFGWVMRALFRSFSSTPEGGVQKLMDSDEQPMVHDEDKPHDAE